MRGLHLDHARVAAAGAFALALVLMLRSAFPLAPGLDYFQDASGAIDALARGDVGDFLDQRALMGTFSLLLRAPFVALVFEQSLGVVYFAGVLPCFAAVMALAFVLRRRMMALGRPAAAVGLVTVVALLNPGVMRSIHWGHPEELLAGALCAGAILAATRGRSPIAGLLLGLAVATKQWALIAAVPVLLAATERRVVVALVAGAVALALTLPSVLAAPTTFVTVNRVAVQASGPIGPANVWWPISRARTAEERAVTSPGFGYAIPAWLAGATHPLIVLTSLPLGWLFWRRRARLAPEDALGLLALLLLLRCLLDPWNNDYYHAPFLLALLAWEAVARSGWPRLTLLAAVALALTFPASAMTFTELSAAGGRLGATYLGWAVPLAGWLAIGVFSPATRDAIVAGVRARVAARPSPARA
jgi:Glycosyltransferase family 87